MIARHPGDAIQSTRPPETAPGTGPGAPARRSPVSLTSRGWGLLAMAGAGAAAADILGIEELYPLAVAAVVLVAYGALWSWRRRWRIDVGRRLQPGRVEAGGTAIIVITLHNRSGVASPVLTLRDPFDLGRRTATMAVAPLPPYGQVSGSYRLPPIGRGVFTLGPLALEGTDPLGLARRTHRSSVVSRYTVRPKVERLRPPRVAAGTDRKQGSTLPISGQGNDEFASLREYQQGDDVRRMHWVSTARTDTLMVRENQRERRGELRVVLDVRAATWSAATFERAVSAAASIACAALDGGLQTRLLTTGGIDGGAGAGRGHRDHLLDLLAEVRTGDDAAGGRPGTRAGGGDAEASGRVTGADPAGGGTVVMITSDVASTGELHRAGGVGTTTDAILVVIGPSAPTAARPAGGSPRAGAGPGRVVRVGPDTPLAAAWDQVA